jgi:hypothetical protein
MGQLLHTEVWPGFFRGIELAGEDRLATVSVLDGEGQPHRVSSPARALRAIRYDADRDVLELGVGGRCSCGPELRYFITSPRRIIVDDSSSESRILIEDGRQALTAIALVPKERLEGPP